MKVLIIAPNVDATDVGEALMAYKWVNALSNVADVSLLTFQRPDRPCVKSQLPRARVVTWAEPSWALKYRRFNSMLKPTWPIFARHVRKWLTDKLANGERFDLAHQLMPQAMRYASPFRHFDIPYVIGPSGGALVTPDAFKSEARGAPLFTRLRSLDKWRLRHDPMLRSSYAGAACVLGVAPYVNDLLADIPLKRFETVLELGIDETCPAGRINHSKSSLKLLHVGRGVRTKGLRDAVRALAHLNDLPDVTLTSAGTGEEIEICRQEAERLGVAGRVTFLGQIPHEEVQRLYHSHDVFCFPSYREPAGGVLYEAMRTGLPIITADRGGPAFIVDDSSGIRVPVTDPEKFAYDLSRAMRRLVASPQLRHELGSGALHKVQNEGLWKTKANHMVGLYESLIAYPRTRSTI